MQKLFEKNIQFFYRHLPEYYKLISNIKQRNVQIKNDNLYFKGKPLYPNSISHDSEILADIPTHNPHWKKDFFSLEPIYWENDRFYITGKIINTLNNKAKSFDSYTKKGFIFDKDFMPTTTIFGLLAGKHLDILVKRHDFQSLFVYEPNPEFFAVSLYFVDYPFIYEKLGERFFLWVNGKIDYSSIERFYYERVITSTFFSLSLKTYEHPLIEDAKNKFFEVNSAKIRGWGTYEDEIKGIKNHLKNITKHPLLSGSKQLNVPICIAANGKSLEQNIPFIKKNRESMILVSVGTALKPLLKAGITSDFHIEQERIDLLVDALKDVLPNYEGYFVGASVVNPKVFEMAQKPLMYIREGFTFASFYSPLFGASPIVGNAGVAFASQFSKEIYLCGMDLGFRLNEKKHAKGSFYDSRDDVQKSGIKIEGNFSDDIYTDSLLLSSKKRLEFLIKTMKLNVYNLSDGAKIEGAVPLKDKTLPKIEKEKAINEIISCFKRTEKKEKNLNLHPILNAFSKSLNFENINSKKELTGRIDFLEDMTKKLEKKNPALGSLLRGSFWHILNNIYILAHKIDLKELNKLVKPIKKELFLYEKDFNSAARD